MSIKNNYITSNLIGNETSGVGGIVGYFETNNASFCFKISNYIAFTSSITGSSNNCNRILGRAESSTYYNNNCVFESKN